MLMIISVENGKDNAVTFGEDGPNEDEVRMDQMSI